MKEASIDYIVKKTARKSLSVSVYCDGTVKVLAPHILPDAAVHGFIEKKSKWIMDKLHGFMPFRPVVRRKNSRAEYLKHREAARSYVARRIPELNREYGFKIGRIAIRNQKSRWGSCSESGNLNFNYRIALLPPHLADYIIVHELCHLGEMNHGRGFWNLVAKTMPDYKNIRKELKGVRMDMSG